MVKQSALVLAAVLGAPVHGDDVSYRKDIAPLWQAKCSHCHGKQSPYLGEFQENKESYKEQAKGPRMDSYADLIMFVGWPDTGALMRRLDDGANTADGKPGNMYQHLGDTEEERRRNLKIFKEWVGEDGWTLKRWHKKGEVPAVTKEELDRIEVKY